MVDASEIRRNIVEFTSYLYNEDFLDRQYFRSIQELQDENDPNFMLQLVSSFVQNFRMDLNEITAALYERLNSTTLVPKKNSESIDYRSAIVIGYRLKGGSASAGALRLQRACSRLVHNFEQHNKQGCLQCLHQVNIEYYLVKNNYQTLFQMEQQLVAAGGSVPVIV